MEHNRTFNILLVGQSAEKSPCVIKLHETLILIVKKSAWADYITLIPYQ